eukprot:6177487-Pleurochrysis_carterae.AAC.2
MAEEPVSPEVAPTTVSVMPFRCCKRYSNRLPRNWCEQDETNKSEKVPLALSVKGQTFYFYRRSPKLLQLPPISPATVLTPQPADSPPCSEAQIPRPQMELTDCAAVHKRLDKNPPEKRVQC